MTTRIASTNIQNATIELSNMSAAAIAALSSTSPTITQLQITNSSYVVLDDTAVSTSGGYIKITGTNFTAGTQVVIGTVSATSVGFVSSTVLNVQVPAQAAGTYIVYVTTNTGSVAILVNGLTYSGTPTWVTGSTLTSGVQGVALSIQLSATGDAPLTYALAAGSSLPPGISLSSSGLLSGTVTGLTVQTLYNFTVNAIDAEAQDSPRAFDITIFINDQYFNYVTTILSANTPSSTFVADTSTNNFNITVTGDTRPSNFGPYTPGYYSNFFDGNGDYLSLPSSSQFAIATSTTPFTIEAWVYLTAAGGVLFCDPYTGGSNTVAIAATFNNASNIDTTTGTTLALGYFNGTSWVTAAMANSSISLNTWTHVACVFTGTTTKIFYNGIDVTKSNTPTPATTWGLTGVSGDAWYIGKRWDSTPVEFMTGYVSNFRFVNGTAVYTANFTPSTTPLTAIANTSLLTCQSNRFIDNSTNNFTITRNGDVTINGFDPFVPNSSYSTYGSGYFDGTGDYALISTTANTILTGNSNFTLELWAYITGTPNTYNSFFGGSTNDLTFAFSAQGSWGIYVAKIGLSPFITTGMSAYNELFNRWNHLAVTKSGNNWNIWVNGVSRAAVTDATTFTNSQKTIGSENGASLMPGYISDIRYTSAVLYTATFTPPTSPLTVGANTQLLTLQNNQPINNNKFLDQSTNNLLMTAGGNAYQGAFNPYTNSWSNYFDGSGDILTVPDNTGFDLSSGDFTIECWIVRTGDSGTYTEWVCGKREAGGGYRWSWNTGIDGSNKFYFGNGSSSVASTTSIAYNTWYHTAVVRSGSTITVYINGTSEATGTLTVNNYGSDLTIGNYPVDNPTYTGYISNLRIVKGAAVYTSNFTPSTSPLTPITYTQLLTCQSARFVDNGPNRLSVTRGGDVTVNKFSPFAPFTNYTPTSYSGYFDGTGDYLSITNGTALGSGNFTIEMWIYMSSYPNAQNALYSNSTAGNAFNQAAVLYISSAGNLAFYNYPTTVAQSTSTISLNQWVHVAAVRNSGTLSLYINGVQAGSGSNSNNISDTTMLVMQGFGGISSSPIGYVSNLRVVVGTAVYTTNFTPSTTPLTAVSGTALLTCQNTTFIDNSTNNFTITAFGNSQPTIQNPFGYTSPSTVSYTPATYSGSTYFDGDGDYVNIPSTSILNLGTNNFTIECWFYDNGSNASYPGILSTVTGWSSGSFSLRYNNTGQAGKFSVHWNPAGDPFLSSSSTWPSRAWHHVALTRSGNTFTLYVNGIVQATATSSNALNLAYGGTSIGWSVWDGASGYLRGFVSDLRIVSGSLVYTGPFVPPTTPLSAVQNTILLVNGANAGIYDSSMINNYETVGNTSISTNIKKYGNSSIYFDGSGDYLITLASPNFVFGTGDFTIECWLYLTTLGADDGVIIELRSSGTTGNGFVFNTRSSGGGYVLNFYTDSAPNLGSTVLSLNAWNHVAVTRSGSTVRLFSNGAVSATITKGNNFSNTPNPTIGQSLLYGNSNITGYIDDLRITKGFARYTGTFTPPTSPFLTF